MIEQLVVPEFRVPVEQAADVAITRKFVRELAHRLGLNRAATEAVATAVSELAWNIVLHAGAGQVAMAAMSQGERRGMVVVAHDQGPGIADLDRALEDGFSTTGSLGLGLASARRLVDEFELRSAPGQGTTIVMKKWAG